MVDPDFGRQVPERRCNGESIATGGMQPNMA
jgi:hypothetical protein